MPSPPLTRLQRRIASVNAAAEYAGVSTKTIRRRISDGTITGYRLGPRTLRVDLNELDAALRPIPTVGGGRDAAA
jgi:excisionase family DNA binding protein